MIAAVTKDISSTNTLTAAMSSVNVLMAAGGTGGHVYPAIAIADALGRVYPKADVLFLGTKNRMEWKTVPKYGYPIKSIWISGLHRRLTIQNLLFPLKLVVSVLQSFFVIRSFKPDVVIACGGFASGPVGWVAAKTGIPLILQEQNSFPGVTNRMLGKHASIIFTAFEEAAAHFPEDKVKLSGNPVRGQLENRDRAVALGSFGFTDAKPVLLILGGSGGARAINEAMLQNIDEMHNNARLQIIWQCGEKYIADIKNRIDTEQYPQLRLMEFIDDISSAYSAADLVVTRAGAGTCSELMNLGQPAVLVPSPNVAGDHQAKNAQSLVDAGAAELLREENLGNHFTKTITGLIDDKSRLKQMSSAMKQLARPYAADTIAKEISTYLNRQTT